MVSRVKGRVIGHEELVTIMGGMYNAGRFASELDRELEYEELCMFRYRFMPASIRSKLSEDRFHDRLRKIGKA